MPLLFYIVHRNVRDVEEFDSRDDAVAYAAELAGVTPNEIERRIKAAAQSENGTWNLGDGVYVRECAEEGEVKSELRQRIEEVAHAHLFEMFPGRDVRLWAHKAPDGTLYTVVSFDQDHEADLYGDPDKPCWNICRTSVGGFDEDDERFQRIHQGHTLVDAFRMSLIDMIGNEFARRLKRYLSDEQWEVMRERNSANIGGPRCASHDFLDANVVMIDAFAEVMGREPASHEGTRESEAQQAADLDLMNPA